MTAAEVQAACVAEGLTLRTSSATNSGYMGVYSNSKGFEVKHNRDYLGFFDTALEAALVYARRAEVAEVLNGLVCQLGEPKMTAAEVQAACVAEGLTLRTSNTTDSGYVGVQANRSKFAARHSHDYLGSFDTPLQAALVYARRVEVVEVLDDLVRQLCREHQPPPEERATPRKRPRQVTAEEVQAKRDMTAEEACAAAAAEGLTLVRSDHKSETATGFKGVRQNPSSHSKPFRAELKPGTLSDKYQYFGYFATAEEAALVIARSVGPEGIAAHLAAEQQAKEEAEERARQHAAEMLARLEAASARRLAAEQQRVAQKEAQEARRAQAKVRIAEREAREREAAAARAEAAAERSRKKAEVAAERQRFQATAAAERQRLQEETARRHAQLAEMQKAQLAAAALARRAAQPAGGFEAQPLDDLVRHVLGASRGAPARGLHANAAYILGLEPGASVEAARKRYLALAKRLHPDKADHPRAAEAFAAVESAWGRLGGDRA